MNFGYRSFNGDVDLHTQQVTVTKQESAQTFSCRAFLNIPYGLPGRSEAHVNLTVPGITYAKPNPPKNVSWTRVNDSSVKPHGSRTMIMRRENIGSRSTQTSASA